MPQAPLSSSENPVAMAYRILQQLADGRFHSGAEIGQHLQLTRAAVWKHIKALREAGMDIHSVRGRGYRLPGALELLCADVIDSQLTSEAREAVQRLDVHFQLDSTNDHLMQRLNDGNVHGHLLLAEYQRHGRGRRSSHWLSPPAAGIYLSVGWRFDELPQDLSCLSLSAGVAVVEALRQFAVPGIGLKWPNDIYCDTAKLGGILVETRTEHGSHADVVVGVGINLALPDAVKAQIPQAVTDLATVLPTLPSRNRLAACVINRLIELLQRYQHSGFQSDIEKWRALDVARERRVTLSLAGREAKGRVLGIDDNGCLLMSVDGIVKTFMSGQLSFKVDA